MESVVAVTSLSCIGYTIARFNADLSKNNEIESDRIKIVHLLVLCVSAQLWPFVQVCILNKEWKSGLLTSSALMWICTMWIMGLFALDAAITAYTPSTLLETTPHQQREVKNTFLSVVSTVFAFGVLLSNIAKKGDRSSRSAQICITGLLIGLAFAIPSFDADGDGFNNHLILAIVKSACLYGVGIFMSGVVLELVILNKK